VYDPLGPHAISLEEIEEIVAEEKLEIGPGDILIVRCGLSKYLRQATPEDKSPFDNPYTHAGVDPTPEFIEWLWNHNIAAVAGDAIAFEAIPASDGTGESLENPFKEKAAHRLHSSTAAPDVHPWMGNAPGRAV
jgi:kynurenine formamidase